MAPVLIKPFLFETDKKDPRFPVGTIVNILLIIALLQVVWGFLQYFKITPNLQNHFRIGGAFGNPGQYTNFITPLLSFALAVFFFWAPPKQWDPTEICSLRSIMSGKYLPERMWSNSPLPSFP